MQRVRFVASANHILHPAATLALSLSLLHRANRDRLVQASRSCVGHPDLPHITSPIRRQVVSFNAPPYSRGIDALALSMNSLLPDDIRVASVAVAPPGFSARFSCVAKEYHYCVVRAQTPSLPSSHGGRTRAAPLALRCSDGSLRCERSERDACSSLSTMICTMTFYPENGPLQVTGIVSNPFRRLFAFYTHHALDWDAMEEAAIAFEGVHNFSAFANLNGSIPVRLRRPAISPRSVCNS